MSDFLEALGTESLPERRGRECSISFALRRMTAPEADALRRALADEDGFSPRRITLALGHVGISTSAQAVERHRRRGKGTGCKCPTS